MAKTETNGKAGKAMAKAFNETEKEDLLSKWSPPLTAMETRELAKLEVMANCGRQQDQPDIKGMKRLAELRARDLDQQIEHAIY